MNRKQQKAMFAKIGGSIDHTKFEQILEQMREKRLLDERMTAKQIIDSYKKNFNVHGVKLQSHVNKKYKPYISTKTSTDFKNEWDGMTQKQRYEKVRPAMVDDWSKKYSKKNWSQLDDNEKRNIINIESDLARLTNVKRRDSLHHGYMLQDNSRKWRSE